MYGRTNVHVPNGLRDELYALPVLYRNSNLQLRKILLKGLLLSKATKSTLFCMENKTN